MIINILYKKMKDIVLQFILKPKTEQQGVLTKTSHRLRRGGRYGRGGVGRGVIWIWLGKGYLRYLNQNVSLKQTFQKNSLTMRGTD